MVGLCVQEGQQHLLEHEVTLNLLSSFGKFFSGQIFLAGGEHYSVAEQEEEWDAQVSLGLGMGYEMRLLPEPFAIRGQRDEEITNDWTWLLHTSNSNLWISASLLTKMHMSYTFCLLGLLNQMGRCHRLC